MKFSDIKPFTRSANYRVNIPWNLLEDTLTYYDDKKLPNFIFDMNPDFQRAHVWTEEKQIKYIEFILREGQSSRDIFFNCPGWQDSYKGPMELVDGKQRIEAARKFMKGDLGVFGGHCYDDFTDRIRYTAGFVFHINNLATREQVLQWYLDLNEGGVVHTKQELDKVKELLDMERLKNI